MALIKFIEHKYLVNSVRKGLRWKYYEDEYRSYFYNECEQFPTISVGAPTAGQTKNGWTYYEKVFTGATSLQINGGGTIDELRLYPKGADMTTYTYQLGRGITSNTDVNSNTMKYEYDPIGCLKAVMDDNGNILKTYNYNYRSN